MEKRDTKGSHDRGTAHLLPESNLGKQKPSTPDVATLTPTQSVTGDWPITAEHADEPPRRDDFPEEEIQREIDEKFALYEILEPGWDSYEADPLNPKSLADARKFLEQRPKDIRLPFPELGSDGIVGLYWDVKRGYASVGFEGNGLFSYYVRMSQDGAAPRKFLGDDYPYSDGWPEEFLSILRELLRSASHRK